MKRRYDLIFSFNYSVCRVLELGQRQCVIEQGCSARKDRLVVMEQSPAVAWTWLLVAGLVLGNVQCPLLMISVCVPFVVGGCKQSLDRDDDYVNWIMSPSSRKLPQQVMMWFNWFWQILQAYVNRSDTYHLLVVHQFVW